MLKNSNNKIEKEKNTVKLMIKLYCHGKGHFKSSLCRDCEDLYSYAASRIDHCPVMETKTFCSSCKVHCYKPEMRAKIKQVMRYSGPRMLFYHPVLAIKHLLS